MFLINYLLQRDRDINKVLKIPSLSLFYYQTIVLRRAVFSASKWIVAGAVAGMNLEQIRLGLYIIGLGRSDFYYGIKTETIFLSLQCILS